MFDFQNILMNIKNYSFIDPNCDLKVKVISNLKTVFIWIIKYLIKLSIKQLLIYKDHKTIGNEHRNIVTI